MGWGTFWGLGLCRSYRGRMSEKPVVSAVEGAEVVFRLGDPQHALPGVRLWEELGLAAELLEFKPVDYGWELRLPRPSVHRMEYLFDIPDAGMRTDPTNPRVVGGAFGEHSWLPLPGYVEAGLDHGRADRVQPDAADGREHAGRACRRTGVGAGRDRAGLRVAVAVVARRAGVRDVRGADALRRRSCCRGHLASAPAGADPAEFAEPLVCRQPAVRGGFDAARAAAWFRRSTRASSR